MLRIQILFILIIGATTACAEDDNPALGKNAALKYWLAFARAGQRPQPQERQAISRGFRFPASPERAKIVERYAGAMLEMQRGAALSNCDWSLEFELDGPGTDLPHLIRIIDLGRAATVCARDHFDNGRLNEAVKLLTDTLRMGRHIEGGGWISSSMEGVLIDLATDSLAALAPNLSKAQLNSLLEELNNLPAPATLPQVLRSTEKYTAKWVRGARSQYERKDKRQVTLSTEMAILMKKLSAEEFDTEWKKYEIALEKVVAAAELPYDEFLKAGPALEQQFKDSGAVGKNLLPNIFRTRLASEYISESMLMLKAGLRMILNNATDANGTRDPYGANKPYLFKKTKFGFTLESAQIGQSTLTLEFGFDPAADPLNPVPVKPPKPPLAQDEQF